MNASSLLFDRFELQPRERRLLADGQPVALGARAFDVLVSLANRAGRLVTKSELMDLAWPGLVVEENNLAAQVSALRKVLGTEVIETIPGRGYRFAAASRAVPAAAPAAPATAPSPAVRAQPSVAGPRLFGRDADLARLTGELRQPGCVTLVGAAGVGKTRLAQAVVASWPGAFAWLDLAPLASAAQVLAALARALDAQLPEGDPEPALARALRGKRVLVVLDNAEHVVDSVAALVVQMTRAAGDAHVLVTSQLPLAVPGERIDRLEPLALPAAALPVADALQEGAVALLVDRVVAADHRFRAGPDTLPLLREICGRLDGLPLALEMAAARVPLLGLQGVRDALAQRFALLTTGHRVAPGRHRTLHAALDWSHGLLGEPERRLFRALGVFAGGFTLDLAAELAADERSDRWAVIDSLAVLVDRSLVSASPDDPPRYSLLETMRAYALEQLAAAGEEASVRNRHARLALDLAQRAHAAPLGAEGAAARQRCHAEIDNAREAMAWALRHDVPVAVALASTLSPALTFTPWRTEVLGWLLACEPLVDDRMEPAALARWRQELASQLVMSEHPRAPDAARAARATYRTLGDDPGLYSATCALVRSLGRPGAELDEACAEMRALLARHPEWDTRKRLLAAGAFALAAAVRGDKVEQLVQRRAEVELAREMGAQNSLDAAETNVVTALLDLGRIDEAIALATGLVQRIGDDESANAAYAWAGLVIALIQAGRYEQALAAAPRARAAGQRFDLPLLVDTLALMAVHRDHPRAAARLLGYARHAYSSRSMLPEISVRERLEQVAAFARSRLDEATVARLITEGNTLDDAAADRLAFAGDDQD